MFLAATLAMAQYKVVPVEPLSFMPGQLEVVAGLRSCPEEMLGLYYFKEIPAQFGGKVVIGGSIVTYNFGYVRYGTTEEDFFGWPSWHVHWLSHTTSKQGKREIAVDCTADFWVDKSGRIHRQRASRSAPDGRFEAQADYFPDHIEIKRTIDGKSSELSLFSANGELQQLFDQFKPMVVDGKVVVREKPYLYLDMLHGTYQKRMAYVSGMFDGKECDAHFHGHAVTIEYEGAKQQACVSDDNDLVKVDLQDGRTIEMTTLPANRVKH